MMFIRRRETMTRFKLFFSLKSVSVLPNIFIKHRLSFFQWVSFVVALPWVVSVGKTIQICIANMFQGKTYFFWRQTVDTGLWKIFGGTHYLMNSWHADNPVHKVWFLKIKNVGICCLHQNFLWFILWHLDGEIWMTELGVALWYEGRSTFARIDEKAFPKLDAQFKKIRTEIACTWFRY